LPAFLFAMARPKAASSPNRRQQILAQAASLFRANGFNATTMRQLAVQLNMEAASLYNHISSKEELLREICFSVANDFNTQLSSVQAEASSPLQKLEAILRFHISMLLSRPDDVYVSNRDWKHLKEPWLTNFLTQRRQYEQQLAHIVQQGIDAGQLRPLQPAVAVLGMLSAVRSIEYWQRSKRPIAGPQATDDLIALLLNGISAK
jgi:AcrR family transcriptional regulator